MNIVKVYRDCALSHLCIRGMHVIEWCRKIYLPVLLFKIQQPLFCADAALSAVSTQRAIFANQAVTGNDDGQRVGTVGRTHRPRGAWSVDLGSNLLIGFGVAVRDGDYCLVYI